MKQVTLNTFPWGTPNSCSTYSEWKTPKLTQNLQLVKMLLRNIRMFPLRSMLCNLFQLSTVSYAFTTSEISTMCYFYLMSFFILHISCIRASTVEVILFQKPQEPLLTILSGSLQMKLVRDVGLELSGHSKSLPGFRNKFDFFLPLLRVLP